MGNSQSLTLVGDALVKTSHLVVLGFPATPASLFLHWAEISKTL